VKGRGVSRRNRLGLKQRKWDRVLLGHWERRRQCIGVARAPCSVRRLPACDVALLCVSALQRSTQSPAQLPRKLTQRCKCCMQEMLQVAKHDMFATPHDGHSCPTLAKLFLVPRIIVQ